MDKLDTVQAIKSKGVRTLKMSDMMPNCEVLINKPLYQLEDICNRKKVADIGCGYGHNRTLVESVGGEWVGVEPFDGGAHTVIGDAQDLPFDNHSFDVVIMDAVLEHIPDVGRAFSEVGRILRPGGVFIGYVAFMECFHEISYSHLSFKALEHYSEINGLKLKSISGGRRFGIDYHLKILFKPIPFGLGRRLIASFIRGIFKVKSIMSYLFLRIVRKEKREVAKRLAGTYFKFECLRQSNGFDFIIVKK